jgi:hypothetical protein
MIDNNSDQLSSISNARSPEEIGEYWDSHSLADHWDQTHEVVFEIRDRLKLAKRAASVKPGA